MRATVVVDIGFGDAGKGSVTDYLVRRHGASAVVRYNGGPQAGHRVVTEDGREHVFAQFGSGTFVPGVETFLSEFMLVNPYNLMREEQHLQEMGVTDALERLTIDRKALIITPFHVAANRVRELARGLDRHGSCGQGVGEAMSDSLKGRSVTAGDFVAPRRSRRVRRTELANKLRELQEAKREELDYAYQLLDRDGAGDSVKDHFDALEDPDRIPGIVDAYMDFAEQVRFSDIHYLLDLHKRGSVVYEGAQGILLDQDFGFHPYTTWTRTTSENALRLLRQLGVHDFEVMGVTRAYAVRHGPGPFPTEDRALELPDEKNEHNRWQGDWRVGHFDAVLANYALAVDGNIDTLAVTCLDRLGDEWDLCTSYRYTGSLPDLHPYFYPGRGLLHEIRAGALRPSNHAQTEALGTRLFDCEPQYMSHDADEVVRSVEDWLRLPVSLVSNGPTAADKEIPTTATRYFTPRGVPLREGHAA